MNDKTDYEVALNAERNTLRLIKRKLDGLDGAAAQRIAEWVAATYTGPAAPAATGGSVEAETQAEVPVA